jgi:hypothetical protein
MVKTFLAVFRRRLFGLQAVETDYARRGFRGATAEIRARLEQIGASFLGGHHAALEHETPADLAATLNSVAPDLRGFAFEGAAMGLALLDFTTPWRCTRLAGFLRGAGHAHAYMTVVGAGWAWARLPVNVGRAGQRLDPLLGWLALDGWGFHEGFFRWPKYIDGQPPPLKGFERRVFDQGFGRSLWFVNGGDIELIARTISVFSCDRQSDLWSGIGLAATYAGIVSEVSLRQLREKSASFQPHVAQGAAFASKARQRAGNLTDYTNLAATILCGLSANQAARLTDDALENLPADSETPAYEIWRRRIQNHFTQLQQLQER